MGYTLAPTHTIKPESGTAYMITKIQDKQKEKTAEGVLNHIVGKSSNAIMWRIYNSLHSKTAGKLQTIG